MDYNVGKYIENKRKYLGALHLSSTFEIQGYKYFAALPLKKELLSNRKNIDENEGAAHL